MSKRTKTNIRKKAMIDALEKSLGIVTTACQVVGIARVTHYEWMKEDPEYKAAVEDVANMVIDFAESHLHKRIKDGSDAATIFFLKCRAKDRGYAEKQEFEHTFVEQPLFPKK